MALTITTVALTSAQKTTAQLETNAARRISLINGGIITNTDASFAEVSSEIDLIEGADTEVKSIAYAVKNNAVNAKYDDADEGTYLGKTIGATIKKIKEDAANNKVDLDYTDAVDKGTITNSGGDDVELPIATSSAAGLLSKADKVLIDYASGHTDGTHTDTDIVGLAPIVSIGAKQMIPTKYIPGSVDDILEVADKNALDSLTATTGGLEAHKLYVTQDDGKVWRYGGSAYVEISASLVIGDTTGSAYDGALGTANADAINIINGNDTTAGSIAKAVKDIDPELAENLGSQAQWGL